MLDLLQRLESAPLAAFHPQEVEALQMFASEGCSCCVADLVKHHQLVRHCAAALGRGLELLRSAGYAADKGTEAAAVYCLASSLKACCYRPSGGEQHPEWLPLVANEVASSGEHPHKAGRTFLVLCATCACGCKCRCLHCKH